MPRGFRTIGFAALAAVVLLSFGLGAYWVSLGQPQQPNRHPSYQASDGIEKGSPATVANVSVSAVKRTPCENPKSETESDLCAQWRAAKAAEKSAEWTHYGVIASAIGISLLLWQIMLTREAVQDTGRATNEMESQNALAREAMERQLRAYLTSSDFKTRGMIGANNRFVEMEIQAIVHNSGQTPALLQFGITDVRIVHAEDEIPDHKVSIGITPPFNSTIGGGLYGTAGSQIFPREVIECAFEGVVKIILYVGIGYKDVFGKFHETRYVMQARPLFHPTKFEQSGGNWKGGDLSPEALFEYVVIHERGSFT